MRTVLFVLLATLAASNAVAEDAPNPAGCAGFAKNTTGSDADCDSAIAKEKDPKAKSVMLFRRAYLEDAAGNFATYPKALADLDEALRLWPDNISALHERAYLYNEYGRWTEAQTDLDRQVRVAPNKINGYTERALARFGLGDLQGVEEDRRTELLLQPNQPRNYIAHARALMWLGRFDEARQDIARATDLAKRTADAEELKNISSVQTDIGLWTNVSDPKLAKNACLGAKTEAEYYKPTFVGDCTRAFLDAQTNKEKADALTQRSMMLPVAKQERSAGLGDLRIAYALDPSNPDHLFNLGSRLADVHRGLEAITYLDMALKLKETHYAYSARASAKYDLGDINGAFADAKKSFEIKPDILALTVLGDCFHTKDKTYNNAKIYWIAAYHLGDRDDGLIARLKDAGVPIPPPDDVPGTEKP